MSAARFAGAAIAFVLGCAACSGPPDSVPAVVDSAAAAALRAAGARQARRDALGFARSRGRVGTELRRRRELAEAAAERLADRPGRRHCRGLARQHLGLSPPANARRELGRRDAASRDERAGRADQRARPSAALRRTQHGLLRARAVGAQVRPRRQSALGVGRPFRSGLPRRELPRGGRLLLACARARHLRGPQRLRVPRGQRRGRRRASATKRRDLSVGAFVRRRRLAHPEVHGRRHVRLSDRHGRHGRAEQREDRRRAERHAAAVPRRGHERRRRRRTGSTSRTATAIGAS